MKCILLLNVRSQSLRFLHYARVYKWPNCTLEKAYSRVLFMAADGHLQTARKMRKRFFVEI